MRGVSLTRKKKMKFVFRTIEHCTRDILSYSEIRRDSHWLFLT